MRKGAQILDRFQKKFGFVVFTLDLSNFWFSFDEGQFIVGLVSLVSLFSLEITHGLGVYSTIALFF